MECSSLVGGGNSTTAQRYPARSASRVRTTSRSLKPAALSAVNRILFIRFSQAVRNQSRRFLFHRNSSELFPTTVDEENVEGGQHPSSHQQTISYASVWPNEEGEYTSSDDEGEEEIDEVGEEDKQDDEVGKETVACFDNAVVDGTTEANGNSDEL